LPRTSAVKIGNSHTSRLAEKPPHPARKSAPTSPRRRGEVFTSRRYDV
jgi:hypothetical protein